MHAAARIERVELKSGESRRVTITADPRLIAKFDGNAGQWPLATGTHRIGVGKSAVDLMLLADVPLTESLFGN